MTLDPAWVVTGVVGFVGGGVLVSHIRKDRSRHREQLVEIAKIKSLRAEVRAFIAEARERLPK